MTFPLECSFGELPLQDTRGCQSNGYTCTDGDGPSCCEGRPEELRNCVPCDETMQIKPNGAVYTTAGNCDFQVLGI